MSSAGQVLGGIAGAVIGFFAGGPAGSVKGALWGAQIGITVGGLIDPPKGPSIVGPRLSDLTVQTSTYGAPIPRIYGSVATTGNIFWLEKNKLKERRHKESSGGKGGGGGSSVTTYTYSATFAVGLCKGPISGIGRVWIGADLIYDPTSGVIDKLPKWAIYLGDETQEADPRIQADRGVADTPAYRGLAYIVFYDLPLKKYGNSLLGAQVKAEVIAYGNSGVADVVVADLSAQGTLADGICYNPLLNEVWAGPHYPTGMTRLRAGDLSVIGVIDTPTRPLAPRYMSRGKKIIAAGSGGGYHAFDATAGTFTNVGTLGAFDYIGIPRDHVTTSTTWLSAIGYSLYSGRMWMGLGGANAGATDGQVRLVDPSTGSVIDSYSVGVAPLRMVEDAAGRVWMMRNAAVSGAARLSCLEIGTGVTADYGFPHSFNDAMVYDPDRDSIWITMFGTAGAALLVEFDIASRTFTNEYTLPFAFSTATDSSPLAYDTHRGYVWVGGNSGEVMGVDTSTGITEFSVELGPTYNVWSIADVKYGRGAVYVCDSGFGMVARIAPPLPGFATGGLYGLDEIVSAECIQTAQLSASDIDVSELIQSVRGYKVTQTGAIRGALDPLQAAWPMDVVQRGYKIHFTPRGTASVATIPASDLDARSNGDAPGVEFTLARELDSMLPQRLTLRTLDPSREYDIGEQNAERLNVASINVRDAELPIVLTATETAQAAERLLHLYWLERVEVGPFRLPPTYLGLEPADVVEIVLSDATYRVRLTSVQYLADGRLECAGKLDSPAVYVPAALGEVGDITGVQTVTMEGATRTVLMDIPLLRASENSPGFPVAISGYLSGWPGGIVIRSADGEVSWTDVASMLAPGTNIGVAIDAIGAGRTDIFDTASVLQVTMGSALQSVSELQVFGGSNLFAYGADGRWEIISAKNCTLQGDGSWVLTDFLRGRFGTEWAMTLHAVGDTLVELIPDELSFVPVESAAIGLQLLYRGITDGDTIDSDTSTAFAYRGVNLECLSPVYLNGNRHPSTNDWTLTWIRRTRMGGEWRDYVDAALGEATEAYEIDIFADGTYATVKRTLTSTTASATYTSAQQVTDFGSNQSTLYVKVYQMSGVVGRGYPLTTSITR